MNTSNKKCAMCQQVKPIVEFGIMRSAKDGYKPWCNLCSKDYRRQWARTSPVFKEYLQRPEVKERYRVYKRKWDRKYLLNPVNRISNNIRGNMYHALKGKKGFRKWEDLVGYTLEDLIKHLSPLLNNGMTWDNYGEVWQIDHVTPKSWYKYDSAEHPLFKECWALNNLQPKMTEDNRRKGNRFKG